MLMVNDVSGGKVFGQPRNSGWLLTRDGNVAEVTDGTKHEVAARIWDAIEHIGM